MTNLSDADKQRFTTLDIRSVCDFRLAEERELKDREFYRFLEPIDVMEFSFDGVPARIERV